MPPIGVWEIKPGNGMEWIQVVIVASYLNTLPIPVAYFDGEGGMPCQRYVHHYAHYRL